MEEHLSKSMWVSVYVCRSVCQCVCVCLRGRCVRGYVREALPGANKPQWYNRRPAGPPEGKDGKHEQHAGLTRHRRALDSTALPALHSHHLKPCGLACEGVIMEAEESKAGAHGSPTGVDIPSP